MTTALAYLYCAGAAALYLAACVLADHLARRRP